MRDTRRTRLVLIVLLVAALVLIAFDYGDGSSSVLRAMRNASGAVFGAAEHAASSVADFFDHSGSTSQVASLQREVAQLRTELSAAQLSKSEYKQLHRLLAVAAAGQYRIIAATVQSFGQGYQQTVTLDAGSADGVRPDETVLNGQGLVGEVTAVTAHTSTVLLATDSSSLVGVEVAPSGQIGYVTGSGKTDGDAGLLHLQMLSSAAVLKPGQALVTKASAHDRPYVPGVPVGVITKLENPTGLTEEALVRPYVDFTALGVVGIVIAPPARNPRFSVLPPLPRPVPTVTVTVTAPPSKPTGSPTPTPGGGG